MPASKRVYPQAVGEDTPAINKGRFKVLVSAPIETSGTVSPSSTRTRRKRASGFVVIVVDPRPLMRHLWTQALKGWASNFRVVALENVDGYADPGAPAVALVNHAGGSGASLQNELSDTIARFHAHRVPVVLLSDNVTFEDIVNAIRSGARGYVPMSSALPLVVEVIKLVAAGGSCVPSEPFIELRPSRAPTQPLPVPSNDALVLANGFSPQQALVLDRLSRGVSNRKIAEQLKIQESAVKACVRHIMNRLGVTNRTQVALAVADLLQSRP